SVSFPVEDDSDIGSPGVDRPPIMPEDPYAERTTDTDGRVSEATWTRKSYAMQPVKYYGLSIDLLFCLATQYRSFVQKMAPKRRTTRLNPGATPTPVTDTHTTTSVTNAQIQAICDATRNGDDNHTSGTGASSGHVQRVLTWMGLKDFTVGNLKFP
ncbi:hypothetical protein Tco_0113741, partial [Tanacetum coccineum]